MARQAELKILRVRYNLTQEQTADLLGVGRQAYSYVERGERKGSPDLWRKIQKLFGLSDGEVWRLMNELDEDEAADAKPHYENTVEAD